MRHTNGWPKGFTLIEILVVVIILGIAGAIVIPQLSTRDDLRAAAAARVIMADLIYAQNLSITKQSNTYVSFSTTSQTYSVCDSTMSIVTHPVNGGAYTQTMNVSSGTNGLQRSSLYSVAFVDTAGTTSLIIGFDDLGTPLVYSGGATTTMASGSVVVISGAYKLQINIEPYTGQISVVAVP